MYVLLYILKIIQLIKTQRHQFCLCPSLKYMFNLELPHRFEFFLSAFEVFHEGSWHAADLISIQDGSISVRAKCPTPTMLENIHTDFMRMRSRKATSLDCCKFLKPGIDVCALLPQPASSNSDHDSQPQVCHMLLTLFYVFIRLSKSTMYLGRVQNSHEQMKLN